ncbi:MAG: iron-containing alcohol dehydrogenase [Candidatus Zixiibacteriota bacterium]
MKNFEFHIPTKIIFGRGEISKLESILLPSEDNILIVTDKIVASKSPAVKTICENLKDHIVVIYDDVEENPSIETITRGKEIAVSSKTDIIIGIGGGSCMDAAKGIAVLATNPGDIGTYMAGKPIENKPLPNICIPTTSGTGSEVTPYAVFTDKENESKGAISNEGIFPRVSIVDPELTYTMPESVIVNTGMDVLTHAVEAYLSTESFMMNDLLALHAIEIVRDNIAKAKSKDKDTMDAMAYASMLAGITIAHASTIMLHIMAYPLTVYHNIPHGKANAILLPEFMNFMRDNSTVFEKVSRLDNMFEKVGGIQEFVNGLGISTSLSDYGINQGDFEIYAEKTIVKGDVKITPAEITKDAIMGIYQKAL